MKKTTKQVKHNCPILGENTNVIMTMTADTTGQYVLYRRKECPLCKYTTGEKTLAPGVKPYKDGYLINTSLAERLT